MADFNVLWEPIEEPSTPSQVLSGELSWLRHLVVPGTAVQSSAPLQERPIVQTEWGRTPQLPMPVEQQPLAKKRKLMEAESTLNVIELGDKPHTSEDCEINKVQPNRAKSKKKNQLGESEKPFSCNQCDYKTARSSHLKIHLTVHSAEKPYACDQCPYKAALGTQLKQHMRIHTGERPYVCNECGFKAKRSYHLKIHALTHTGEKPFGCNLCDFKSASRPRLKLHIKTHTGEKPFACDECDYRAISSQLLKRHKLFHTGEKPHACDECDFKTVTAQLLRRHKMSHSGEIWPNNSAEKVYICDQCGYKCFSSAYLVIHMRKHTGEKPYACDQCSYRSAEACTLKRHKRIHSGEKPHACDHCEFRSARANTLKIHKKVVHGGEKPYTCKECDFKCSWSTSLKLHKKVHSVEFQNKKRGKRKQPKKKTKKTKKDENESTDADEDVWDALPSSDEDDTKCWQIPGETAEDSKFTSYNELLVMIEDFTKKELLLTEVQDDQLFIFKLDANPHLRIKYSLTVTKDLDVTAVYDNVELKDLPGFKFPFRSTNVLDIQGILSRLDRLTPDHERSVLEKTTAINKLLSSLACEDNENQIRFLKEQISLVSKFAAHRHSPETMAFFSILYTISPHSYKYFRRSQYLSIPHPKIIADLSSYSQYDEQQSFMKEMGLNGFNYEPALKAVKPLFRHTREHDRTVVVLMDEIRIKPFMDFKEGGIVDLFHDFPDLAPTAYTFMISSIRSEFEEMVHIVPAHSFSAEKLHNVLKNLIVALEKIGFRVVGVVSDNLPLNRNAVSHFSNPPKLSIAYLHPCDKCRPLFYVIDTVHLTKCIRNDWIDSLQQTIAFPNFHDELDKHCLKAKFSDLKNIFGINSAQLGKYPYPLTVKGLNPSKTERQNMKLVLQLFNDGIIERLKISSEDPYRDCSGTLEFVKIITEWCKALDITRGFEEGFRKPLKLDSESSEMKFLDEMLIWLDRWEQVDSNMGSLSAETISNLKHSSYAIAEITKYCVDELKIDYFLPGKLQIHSLERQFGQYIQLTGSLFHLTVPQIREYEKKLGFRSFSLIIKDKINVYRRSIIGSVYDWSEDEFVATTNLSVDVDDEDLKSVNDILPILVYVSGYCSKLLIQQFNECIGCTSIYILDDVLPESNSCSLISVLSQGGLNHPQDFSLTVTAYCYVVFSKILNDKTLKNKFSQTDIHNQRNILLNEVLNALYAHDLLKNGDCSEGHSILSSTKKYIRAICNTLMNIFRWAPNKIVKPANNKVDEEGSDPSCKSQKPTNTTKPLETDKNTNLVVRITKSNRKTHKIVSVSKKKQRTRRKTSKNAH